jgi:hypothetical protein
MHRYQKKYYLYSVVQMNDSLLSVRSHLDFLFKLVLQVGSISETSALGQEAYILFCSMLDRAAFRGSQVCKRKLLNIKLR